MSAVRNFALTLLISLIVFGILSYGILQFATSAFNLNGTNSVTENTETSEADTEPVAPPEDMTNIKGESFTVLLIGTDYLPDVYNDYEYTDKEIGGFPAPTREVETDTLILMRFNKETGECIICPIPATTEVKIDGHASTLQHVYARQGIDTLKAHINYLTGIPVDYYAIMTIANLSSIIDSLGGVEFNVPENMHYVDLEASLEINILKGTRVLDGKTATDMLRYWSYADEDVTRRRVAKDFLKALITKVLEDISLKDAATAYLKYQNYIETDFGIGNLAAHADLIFSFPKMTAKELTYPGKNTGKGLDARFTPNVSEGRKLFEKYKFKG